MATIVKPNTFTAGTAAVASEVNSNFDTIYNDYNSNITNVNIASNAAIVDTKLAQITTASKVHGTSLTGLASISTAAGQIPNVNLATISSANLVSAASITSLASLPSVAGQIPNVNLAVITSAGLVSGASLTSLSSIVSSAAVGLIPAFALATGATSSTVYLTGVQTWASITTSAPGMQYTDTRYYVGSFTRDTSLASGTQQITGIGFQPRFVYFLTSQPSSTELSIGIDSVTSANCIYQTVTAGTFSIAAGNSVYVAEAAQEYYGDISGTDSDSFTMNWTRSGTPSGTITIYFVAFR